jgi:hypothetical protein
MVELIGRTKTQKLLKGASVTIDVPPSVLGIHYLHAEVSLEPPVLYFGHERCINARGVNDLIDKQMGRKVLEGYSDERSLSWLYPKLMLLLSDPAGFNRKAG